MFFVHQRLSALALKTFLQNTFYVWIRRKYHTAIKTESASQPENKKLQISFSKLVYVMAVV